MVQEAMREYNQQGGRGGHNSNPGYVQLRG